MKYSIKSRTYTMSARKASTEQNGLNILKATVDLWKEKGLNDITLENVAERSGVTVRTILRRYGSKEGLLEATLEIESKNVPGKRFHSDSTDLTTILQSLVNDYEEYGDASIRTLQSEETLPIAKKINVLGRQLHESWCAQVFAPYLPPADAPDYKDKLYCFYASTDVYLWKLLRRDFGLSPEKTLETLYSLVHGLILQSQKK